MPALRESKHCLAVPSVVWGCFARTVLSLAGLRSRMPLFALSGWLFFPTTVCVARPRRAGMHARSTGEEARSCSSFRGVGMLCPHGIFIGWLTFKNAPVRAE
jgi:hypothetical protein